jgi:hypothetical protein
VDCRVAREGRDRGLIEAVDGAVAAFIAAYCG